MRAPGILVAGAGPAGLMTACLLQANGIPFRIVDERKKPAAYSGALFIQAGSLGIFDRLGIVRQALNQGTIIRRVQCFFNGRRILDLDISEYGAGLAPFPYLLALEQSKTERLLIDQLRRNGAQIERMTRLTGFTQDATGATSAITLPDGSEERVRTSYLIGADGAGSLVRQGLGIPFPGSTHPRLLAIIDGEAEIDLPPNCIGFSFTDSSAAGFFPLSDGRWRIDHLVPAEWEGKDQVDYEDIRKGFAERVSMPVNLKTVQWFSVFRSHSRLAPAFQKGRCFLAGDAAHVFTPVGAQGMNSGFQDAFLLVSKLARVIGNTAPPAILDSYSMERRTVAAGIAQASDRVFTAATSRGPMAKWLRLHVAPFLFQAFRPVFHTKKFGAFLFKAVSQTKSQK